MRYYDSHFTDERIEVQRREDTHSRTQYRSGRVGIFTCFFKINFIKIYLPTINAYAYVLSVQFNEFCFLVFFFFFGCAAGLEGS